MQLELLYLILGLAGLLIGSELVIRAILNISKHYKISHLFLGLVILSIGTDLPELVVDVTGAIYRLKGIETSGLIIGETIGTCFSQIGLVLGIIALFGLVTLTKKEIFRDGLMMVSSVVLLMFASYDGIISRTEGLIFVLIFCLYLLVIYREEHLHEKIKRAPGVKWFWDVISIIGGFIIIYFGSSAVIDNGLSLATTWGVSQTIIGITLVGLGTSLPELAIALNALRKGAVKLSAANLIGSNTFDILFTLGLGSAISGFNVSKSLLTFDIPLLLLFSLLVCYFFYRKMKIQKKEAIILLLIYFGYIGIKIFTSF
tara:strand:- start:910 stop:1854 length:945 start_codon:yes stop_codon:yes gene_type:complete